MERNSTPLSFIRFLFQVHCELHYQGNFLLKIMLMTAQDNHRFWVDLKQVSDSVKFTLRSVLKMPLCALSKIRPLTWSFYFACRLAGVSMNLQFSFYLLQNNNEMLLEQNIDRHVVLVVHQFIHLYII